MLVVAMWVVVVGLVVVRLAVWYGMVVVTVCKGKVAERLSVPMAARLDPVMIRWRWVVRQTSQRFDGTIMQFQR